MADVPQPDDPDRLYLDLKGARERLCRAQTGLNPTDSAVLQAAIDCIDVVGCDLPQWSRHDGGWVSHQRAVVAGNACCGGNGAEASCEVCRD